MCWLSDMWPSACKDCSLKGSINCDLQEEENVVE